jgi:hypothetical protein
MSKSITPRQLRKGAENSRTMLRGFFGLETVLYRACNRVSLAREARVVDVQRHPTGVENQRPRDA